MEDGEHCFSFLLFFTISLYLFYQNRTAMERSSRRDHHKSPVSLLSHDKSVSPWRLSQKKP
jgi:hypothetical protein